MEPPPPAAPPVSAASLAVSPGGHLNYADSIDSSPRSRNADSWDEQLFPAVSGGGGPKLRLMCSYGGHIVPRPHDKSLCYVGGDTRIVVVDRHSTLSDLSNRLSKALLNGRSFTLKYQLPNEDLDSLISVTSDEDVENMIEEYDRLNSAAAANNSAQKSSRLRVFLFLSKSDSASSFGSLLEDSTKSEDWFLSALNGSARGFSESATVNCLLGLDGGVAVAGNSNSSAKDVQARLESFGNVKGVSNYNNKQGGQDVHSVPDSPMLDTSSSFGSTSSSPSLANLPPIRVHVDDQKAALGGIEEQFSQMSVGPSLQKQEDGGFSVLPSQPAVLTTVAAAVPVAALGSAGFPGDFSNRAFSEDERSEQEIPVGYRKPPQTQAQQLHPQSQSRPTGGIDLASPDSVSSDSSATNPLSRQRPLNYQEPVLQNSFGSNGAPVSPVDPNSRAQMQQVQDSGYVIANQFDQIQQLNPQQQPQQFLQAGTHYIQHHPTGATPMTSYYPVYPPQQQTLHPHQPLDQQYMYYMPARQAQAYNFPVQQQNYSEAATTVSSSRPQTPPPSTMMPSNVAYNGATRNVPASKPEMAAAGMYRTATATAPSLIPVPSSQHQQQYVGFSQMHHPSQSGGAPTSAAIGNYAYEFADPAHAQMYYSQHLAPQLAAQYQTSAQFPTDNVMQQIRNLQP